MTTCEAMMNTHLAMGWSMCGKEASCLLTKQGRDFPLCVEHAAQHPEYPQRPIPASSSEKASVKNVGAEGKQSQ